MYCNNCNSKNHTYSYCRHPTNSYGIILINKDTKEILMSQRQLSLSIIELLQGRYVRYDSNFIKALFNDLTKFERDKIIESNFNYDYLYSFFYGNRAKNINKNRYKFNTLFSINNYKKMLHECNVLDDNQWGFPKGRQNSDETPFDCALREFHEETDILIDHIDVIDHQPIVETFFGTNGRMYKHTYFLANLKVNSEINCSLFKGNSEIKKIKFFKINDAVDMIKPYYKKRISMIKNLMNMNIFK